MKIPWDINFSQNSTTSLFQWYLKKMKRNNWMLHFSLVFTNIYKFWIQSSIHPFLFTSCTKLFHCKSLFIYAFGSTNFFFFLIILATWKIPLVYKFFGKLEYIFVFCSHLRDLWPFFIALLSSLNPFGQLFNKYAPGTTVPSGGNYGPNSPSVERFTLHER